MPVRSIGSIQLMDEKTPFLTIFTSTYNRAHTLPRLYDSLNRQTDKNFEWIIVDDGSTDNTEEIIKQWLEKDCGFSVSYIRKKNEGFHTGYNTAIANMNSVLAMCIDSDDYVPDQAVEMIHKCWVKRGSNSYGGIIGLDCYEDGKIIGGMLPENLKAISLIKHAQGKYNIAPGDKKIVVRTDLYKSVAPMKVFPGEKYFNPHYMHLEISRKFDFLCLNECLCLVEYQPDGMSTYIFHQYKNSPNSFLEIRKQFFTFQGNTMMQLLKNGIHFVSSALLAHRIGKEFKNSNYKGIIIISFIPGLALALLTIIKG